MTLRCCFYTPVLYVACALAASSFAESVTTAQGPQASTSAETKTLPSAQADKSDKPEEQVESQADRWKREEVMRRALGRDSSDDMIKDFLQTLGVPVLLLAVLIFVLRLRG